MKKLHLLLLSVTLCLFSACHDKLWDAIDGLDARVTKLEELCKEMNTNITSLQTFVDVLQSNDYITGIVEIKKNGEVIGYTITFGKHEPITIYHGQDGKDGADGKDGQDGSANAPVIGVAQDTDGVYYWTLNGEWLLDDNGNKLPVSGKDGQNGTNGAMPQLKIEEGYWYVSYNNGASWTELGKAIGEDGNKGDKGDTGDSMFQSVTQDENYVYFTLADGTVIKIVKGDGSNDQPNSEFIFTITYDPNGGEGVMAKDTFYYGYEGMINPCSFIREGYYYVNWNTTPDGTGVPFEDNYELLIDKNITLYAQWGKALSVPTGTYVDLGLSVKWATCDVGAQSVGELGDKFAWGEIHPKEIYSKETYIGNTKHMTLKLCDDAAAVNWGGAWRMPTKKEWQELLENCTAQTVTINNVEVKKVTSKINNNSIYFPYDGAPYWSSTYSHYQNSHSAICAQIKSSWQTLSWGCYNGCYVRAVRL